MLGPTILSICRLYHGSYLHILLGVIYKRLLMLTLLFFQLEVSTLLSQVSLEICDNGIDDDADGRIDLQDDDCACAEWTPISLTPNPSFENQECCPEGPSSVPCAIGWMQAAIPTPDYFHSCDYSGVDIFDLPQPIPDGEGFVGLIDGVFTNGTNANWKEYIGAVLSRPLEVDSTYQLEFYAGFADREVSPEINFALFGSVKNDNLPFGGDDPTFGCPTRSSEWVNLGGVDAVGHEEWKKYQIIFKALTPISSIVFGPDCNPRSANRNPYHFIDNVILAKLTDFDVHIKDANDPCSADFTLSIRPQDNTQYQWYHDGVAILGATQATLTDLPGAGIYTMRLLSDDGCKVSKPYEYFPPVEFEQSVMTICEGDTLQWFDQKISQEGVYQETLKTQSNCDSILELRLSLTTPVEIIQSEQILEGQSFQLGDIIYDIPGNYTYNLSSSDGCDTIINLELSLYSIYVPNAFSPSSENENSVFSVFGNDIQQNIFSLTIMDRWGSLVYTVDNLQAGEGWDGRINGELAANGIYIYVVKLRTEGNSETQLSGTFALIR